MPGLGPPTPAGPAGLGTIPPGILGPPGTMGPWSPGPLGGILEIHSYGMQLSS